MTSGGRNKKMINIRKILLVFGMLLVAPAVFAKSVKIGDTKINVVLPPGYCELQEKQKSDGRVLRAIRGMIKPVGNTLLSASAPCTDLASWRANKITRMPNMIQYQTATIAAPADSNEEVKKTCADRRQNGEHNVAQLLPSVKERAAKVMKKMEYGKMEMIGVTDEAPGVCYVALLQKFRAEDKTDVTQLTSYAILFVRGKLIYLYSVSDYENANSVMTGLAREKDYVSAFIAANGK
jgi:hypothetical protein